MSFPLPKEIIVYHLIPLLSPKDALNLAVAFNLEVTREVYNAVFYDNTRYNQYGLSMFLDRTRARLYILGDPRYITVNHIDAHGRRKEGERSVYTPLKIKRVRDTIVQIGGGGAVMQARKLDNALLCIDPKGQMAPFSASTEPWGGIGEWPVSESSKLDADKYHEKYWNTASGRSFVSFTSNGHGIFALDDQGLCWKCYSIGEKAYPLLWMDNNFHLIMDRILQLRSCSTVDSCMFEGKGIAVGTNIGPRVKKFGESLTCMIVPGTGKGVKDWVILHRYLIYLKLDGSVTSVNIRSLQSNDPPSEYLDTLPYVNALGGFVQISAYDDHFALLSDSGEVCIVCEKHTVQEPNFRNDDDNEDEDEQDDSSPFTVEVVDGLKGLDIASVAVGSGHYLALTQQGDVYVWGNAPSTSACLGLGRPQEVEHVEGVKLERVREFHGEMMSFRWYFYVEKPMKIKLPGKVYAIFAGNDFSGMLVDDK